MSIDEIELGKHYQTRRKDIVFSGKQIVELGKISTDEPMAQLGWIMLMDQLSETDLPVTNPQSRNGLNHSFVDKIKRILSI